MQNNSLVGNLYINDFHRSNSMVGVLQTDVVRLVEEPFPLDTGHVQHIQLRHDFFHGGNFLVLDTAALQLVLDDVPGEAQLFGGNEDELDAGIPGHGTNQRVDRGYHQEYRNIPAV